MSSVVTVEVGGVECQATVRRSRRARVTKIRALRDGLEVVLPWRAPARAAEDILRSNANWVLRHTLRIVKELRTFDPARLLYEGEEWRISVAGPGRTFLVDREQKLFLVSAKDMADARRIVGSKLRGEAKEKLTELVKVWSVLMAVHPTGMAIRDQKSKWGSCSARGRLNFNWRLVLAPKEVMQAIVIHELAHLAHLNHGPGFWAMVAKHDPDHKKHEKWLKDHQHRLMEPFEPV